MDNRYDSTRQMAETFLRFLRDMKAERVGVGPVFYAWMRDDRLILVVDPARVQQRKVLSNQFRHDLSTILQGRRVLVTNTRGIYVQIAWETPHESLVISRPLNLLEQPSPTHVPMGMTNYGPLWLNLIEMDAVLVGGSRRMGKTRLLHGWIQALLRGGRCRLFLWDGKGGIEFSRYRLMDGVTVSDDLDAVLYEITKVMVETGNVLRQRGISSLAELYQMPGEARIPYTVLVVDELAHVPQECKEQLSDLVGRGGAYGVYPVFATTYPGSEEVKSMARANLSTRIAFPVPTMYESRVILGQPGAEKLPKRKGRLLLNWGASMIEIQAFGVELDPVEYRRLPELTTDELEMIRAARDENGGRMTIAFAMSLAPHLTETGARRLVEGWENKGWLRKDPAEANARKLTPAILELYELENTQTAQTAQTAQTPQTVQIEA